MKPFLISKEEAVFVGKEVPKRLRKSVDYIYSMRLPGGVSQVGYGEEDVDTFLWSARMKDGKVLYVKIKDGDGYVLFKNVLNLPEPHTPEWYIMQEF